MRRPARNCGLRRRYGQGEKMRRLARVRQACSWPLRAKSTICSVSPRPTPLLTPAVRLSTLAPTWSWLSPRAGGSRVAYSTKARADSGHYQAAGAQFRDIVGQELDSCPTPAIRAPAVSSRCRPG